MITQLCHSEARALHVYFPAVLSSLNASYHIPSNLKETLVAFNFVHYGHDMGQGQSKWC